ncbi:hypothetical protein pipiens_001520 [Culex pipiens pipiens]|uniref:Serpin domain-containing protein n=1 Tax=Culex pipiens pipiens TaxID=38569 RepID=A0ABD1CMQ6_CULPP
MGGAEIGDCASRKGAFGIGLTYDRFEMTFNSTMAPGWLYLIVLIACASSSDLDNTFSIELFRQTYLREQRNFVIAPPVIRASFGLLYQVANRPVTGELQRVMQLAPDKFQAAVDLKDSLKSMVKGREHFETRCKMFRDQVELSEKFSALFLGYFKPEVEFSSLDDQHAVITVTPKDYRMRYYDLKLSSDFRLNALFRNQFDPQKTENKVFKALNGYWMTSFMRQSAHFGIARLDKIIALEMHYSWSSELTMMVIMPAEEEGVLSEVVQRFDLATYHAIDRALRQRYMEVSMPKVTLEGNVPLGVPLAKMGVVSAFLHNGFDLYRYRGSGLGVIEQRGSVVVAEGGSGAPNGTSEY